jgi:hypothetical protein
MYRTPGGRVWLEFEILPEHTLSVYIRPFQGLPIPVMPVGNSQHNNHPRITVDCHPQTTIMSNGTHTAAPYASLWTHTGLYSSQDIQSIAPPGSPGFYSYPN